MKVAPRRELTNRSDADGRPEECILNISGDYSTVFEGLSPVVPPPWGFDPCLDANTGDLASSEQCPDVVSYLELSEEDMVEWIGVIISKSNKCLQYALHDVLLSEEADTDVLLTWTPGRLRQRLTMGILFCSTGGINWTHTGVWSSNLHECDWMDPEYLLERASSGGGVQSQCNGGMEITHLILPSNNLQGTLPRTLPLYLPKLQAVNLSNNALESYMPHRLFSEESAVDSESSAIPSLAEFDTQRYLDLSHNQLQGFVPMKDLL
jgi:hypothetical protein